MKKSEAVRLITAYCNLKTFKTVDEFSGDLLMTLEEGEGLVNYLTNTLQMVPPTIHHNSDICLNWVDEFGVTKGTVELNEWEHEDETE